MKSTELVPLWPWNWLFLFSLYIVTRVQEKKNGIWLSTMTKTIIPTENSTTNWQHKDATKNFDYTKIADRLRTVSWSNNGHPTGVVKWVYGYPAFPLTTKGHISLCLGGNLLLKLSFLKFRELSNVCKEKWQWNTRVTKEFSKFYPNQSNLIDQTIGTATRISDVPT